SASRISHQQHAAERAEIGGRLRDAPWLREISGCQAYLEDSVGIKGVNKTSRAAIEEGYPDFRADRLNAIGLVRYGDTRIGKRSRQADGKECGGIVCFDSALKVRGVIGGCLGSGVRSQSQSKVRRSGTGMVHHDCSGSHVTLAAS